jgi:hypothetical protein
MGPAIAAVGIALFARGGMGGSYWTTIFPAVCLLGFGMTITVAPLTTAVMGAVETQHSGVASGINNTVSRVAGLLTIAIFGVFLARAFESDVRPQLDHLALPAPERAQIDAQLPKMAGAELKAIQLDEQQRASAQMAIDEAFVSGFRMVILGSAILALVAAGFGAAIRNGKAASPKRSAGAPGS